jgi:hypothetical protein
VICGPGPTVLGLSGVDGIYGAERGNKQSLSHESVLHEVTYILLVMRVGQCVRHPYLFGYKVGLGMDELFDFVDPKGEVGLSGHGVVLMYQVGEKTEDKEEAAESPRQEQELYSAIHIRCLWAGALTPAPSDSLIVFHSLCQAPYTSIDQRFSPSNHISRPISASPLPPRVSFRR